MLCYDENAVPRGLVLAYAMEHGTCRQVRREELEGRLERIERRRRRRKEKKQKEKEMRLDCGVIVMALHS